MQTYISDIISTDCRTTSLFQLRINKYSIIEAKNKYEPGPKRREFV